MRRKDRERDEAFAWEVLKAAPYATLAMTGQDARPTACPSTMWWTRRIRCCTSTAPGRAKSGSCWKGASRLSDRRVPHVHRAQRV